MHHIDSLFQEVANHPLESAAKLAVGGVVARVASTPIGCQLVTLGMKWLLPGAVTAPFFENEIIQTLLPFFPNSDLAAAGGLAATWITSNSIGCLSVALTAAMFFTSTLIQKDPPIEGSGDLISFEKGLVGSGAFCIAKSPFGPALTIMTVLSLIEKTGLYKGFDTPGSKLTFAGKCLVANLLSSLVAKVINTPTGYSFLALAITGVLMASRMPTVSEAQEKQITDLCKDPQKFLMAKAADLLLSGKISLTQEQVQLAVEQIVAKT